jgi:DNA-binding transcriptional ArsR family regulator
MTTDQLSHTFAALADPTRRAILARLASGECSVGELAAPFDMSMPAVSKHLRVLERAGLIAQRREAQWRHCRIEAAPIKQIADWTEHYRRLWEGRLDRMGAYLEGLKAQDMKTKTKTKTENPTRTIKKEKSHDRKPRRQ